MPIHHAVLALLAEGPSYGYELKSSFEESIGPQWGELNIGHLYQVLDRLVRDDLVTSKVIAQEDRPDKIVYRMTAKGRRELDDWLGQPFVRQSGYRDDFFLKLFAASRLGKRTLRQTIKLQREAYLAELASLGELRSQYRELPWSGCSLKRRCFIRKRTCVSSNAPRKTWISWLRPKDWPRGGPERARQPRPASARFRAPTRSDLPVDTDYNERLELLARASNPARISVKL